MQSKFGAITFSSESENQNEMELVDLLQNCPIPDDEILANLGLFLTSKSLSRILFMNHIYSLIINTPGIVVEFGTRWGQNMALFSALRGIYDPFNRHRKLIAFDTFNGFPSVSSFDGNSKLIKEGNLSVPDAYEEYLERILQCHENSNPLGHIKKFEIMKGDAPLEFYTYLENHPETIIALAYFDFDIYEPTALCLNVIKPYLTKGSILAFDELNDPDSPGETIALKEVFPLETIRLQRFPYTSRVSYFVVE